MKLNDTQKVRIFDVLILAPFLIWAGIKQTLPIWAGIFLILAGIGTALYNGYNFFENW